MSLQRLLLTGALVCILSIAAAALRSWTNGQNASSVLGQPDFTTSTPDVSATKMSAPWAIAVDPTTGKVFVSEQGNNRVLRFSSAAALANGAAAEAVFGQPDFTSNTGGFFAPITARSLNSPRQIVVDALGRLWVADSLPSRVLRFDDASNATNGAAAAQVIGQSSFTTGAGGTTQATLALPYGLTYDNSSGRLWVADTGNNRVLRYENAASRGNGPTADGVLGQIGFSTSTQAVSASGMNSPYALTLDRANGRLWVADSFNNRVIRFENAGAKANGAAADGVLGQPDLTSAGSGLSQSLMSNPGGITLDRVGRLYVADTSNRRVLVFYPVNYLNNGAWAANVLGQPDFTTSNTATDQSTLGLTYGVAADPANEDQTYVGDISSNRVLRFVAAGVPTAASVSVSGRVTNSNGFGLRGVRVTLTAANGSAVSALTNTFGYYRFAEIPAGVTYAATAASKGFNSDTRVLSVNDAVSGFDFVIR